MSTHSSSAPHDVDVIVVGAGPVGLSLAIDLGRRGVRCLLAERNPTTAPWPKMDRTNARSMELWRRIGVADRVRALGYPADNPMDVFLLTRMSEPALAVLRFPSVAERRQQIATCRDGSMALEPYQLVSQNKVEPLLKSVAEATPNVWVRYGYELVDFSQDDCGVSADLRRSDGSTLPVRASYLCGCDGGSSTVRKKLGIPLQGQGGIRELRQVIFRSDDLYERIPVGRGRHYNFVDGSVIVAQGDRVEFTLHTALPADSDFVGVLRGLIGFDCQLRVEHVLTWRHHLLTARRFRQGRVMLAGDAVHLVIPTGGLGMNTGLGDAFDLSWKLSGTVLGWGGPGLLDSYEHERRPVALRNVHDAGWASEGVGLWRALVGPQILDPGAAGEAMRQDVAAAFSVYHARMHGMVGTEMAYTYADSPLVAQEPGNVAEWETSVYHPHARPGVRLPHVWLADGRALQDALGDGYNLLDLRGRSGAAGESADMVPLVAAFESLGAPLTVLCVNEPHIREVLGRSLLLLRPDLHIAWSGHGAPDDATALARRCTGWAAAGPCAAEVDIAAG